LNSEVVFKNCLFEENRSTYFFSFAFHTLIQNKIFFRGSKFGGGIFAKDVSSLVIQNSTFAQNSAGFFLPSHSTLSNRPLNSNPSRTERGSALYTLELGDLLVTHSNFDTNLAIFGFLLCYFSLFELASLFFFSLNPFHLFLGSIGVEKPSGSSSIEECSFVGNEGGAVFIKGLFASQEGISIRNSDFSSHIENSAARIFRFFFRSTFYFHFNLPSFGPSPLPQLLPRTNIN